ncbi:hypothetical protein [Psychroserpens algicola]|uniref:Lipoprotein n=1 Tax=Psychroserpens algicola TaxID=1719034 RepID=A0ABT0H977_9FLAO|nr:hypothetical protein [Psychroserpens algicola]MCK8480936.1 hypothetical protein [Psychroserpens algicola]
MKKLYFYGILPLFLMLNSCGLGINSAGNKYLTVEQGAIPPEFGKDGTVLLLVEDADSNLWYKKYINKHAENKYTGPYKIIQYDELDASPYSNKEKYRYVFLSDNTSKIQHIDNTGVSSSEWKYFLVYDRLTEKQYKSKTAPVSWAKFMGVYFEKLDAKRIENGG